MREEIMERQYFLVAALPRRALRVSVVNFPTFHHHGVTEDTEEYKITLPATSVLCIALGS